MSRSTTLFAGQKNWTIDNIIAIAESQAGVEYKPAAATRRRIKASVKYAAHLWRNNHRVYGITTGYGASVDRAVPQHLVKELSRQITRFHRCGMGDFFNEEETAAILATRLNSLVRGFSGVREEILERLVTLIQESILPIIPKEGSVGASGDLTPLAYVAAVIMGEGQVRHAGRIRSATEVYEELGLAPLNLNPKEGLSLMNGTSVMTALACLALKRATYLERLATRITSLSVLALKGNPFHFEPRLFELKEHPGPVHVAARIFADIKGGASGKKSNTQLQNTYALRCAPHIIGVLTDALPWMKRDVTLELNSSNDNPLIDGERKLVMHGGHFYGGHIAFAMDSLKTAVANVADLLDRQLALLVDQRTNQGLPANLSGSPKHRAPINHGFKAIQIGTSAWTAEALKLTMPASVFSRSTECHNQDKVSLGTIAARDALRVLELTEQVAAAVLMGALQGIELRIHQRELTLKKCPAPIRKIFEQIRSLVKFLEEDRPMDVDIRNVVAQIRKRAWLLPD